MALDLDLLGDLRARPLRAGERFSHVTAARAYGLPLPSSADTRIHVTAATDGAQSRRSSTVGHRDSGSPITTLLGVPLSGPERTFIELGRMLHPDALVAVGDHLVHAPRIRESGRPWTTTDRIEEACREQRAGVVNARRALELVRPGVESPTETALRLLLLRAGLPEPTCGYELRSPTRAVGWFDLGWPERRALGEYDGDQHRTSTEQYEKDIRRFDQAAELGWQVVRVRADGMRQANRSTTVARFRAALRASTPDGRP